MQNFKFYFICYFKTFVFFVLGYEKIENKILESTKGNTLQELTMTNSNSLQIMCKAI